MTHWNVIVVVIILLVTAGIFLFAMYGPEGLLNVAKWTSERVFFKWLPDKPGPDLIPNTNVDDDVKESYTELYNLFKNNRNDKKGCFVKFDNFPKNLDDWRIEINIPEENNMHMVILNKKNQRLAAYDVDGIEPCIVIGEKETENFYNRWLKKDADRKYIGKEYQTFPTIIIRKEEVDDVPKDKYVLYKADENHLCFLRAYSWDWIWKGCSYKPDGIRNNCFDKLIKLDRWC